MSKKTPFDSGSLNLPLPEELQILLENAGRVSNLISELGVKIFERLPDEMQAFVLKYGYMDGGRGKNPNYDIGLSSGAFTKAQYDRGSALAMAFLAHDGAKIYNNSNRLLRSLKGRSEENIFSAKFNDRKNSIDIEYGTKVPYADLHERGGRFKPEGSTKEIRFRKRPFITLGAEEYMKQVMPQKQRLLSMLVLNRLFGRT